jgi:hypothetical protein
MATSATRIGAVNVWLVREGPYPTDGEPAYRLPFDRCVKVLGLLQRQRFCELGRIPRFGERSLRKATVRHYRHVVCEVDEAIADAIGWRSGFYLLELSPGEVADRLTQPAGPRKS